MSEAPLLDTHIWIWWVLGDSRLKRSIAERLDRLPENQRPVVSAISLWEVAMLVSLGRLKLEQPLDEWYRIAASPRTVRTWPITPGVAAEVARLPPGFNRDPADRLIVATGRDGKLPVLTMDRRILNSKLVRIWKP